MPPRASFEPTKASATVLNVNTIPGSWSFCMDIRVVPKYNVDEVAQLQKAKNHTMGRYVAVAVTDDTDNANKVIDRYFA